MKNTLLIISILFFIFSCAGRKARTSKKIQKSYENTEIDVSTKLKKDSTSFKVSEEVKNTNFKAAKSYWKYTAPVSHFDSVIFKKPFWIILNGDSIDVAGLPYGSSLESGSENSESSEYFQKMIKDLSSKNSELETKLKAKSEKKAEIIERTREVEKQSIQWILVGIAFLVGVFIKPIYRGILKFIKLKIPLLWKKN